MKFLRKVVQWLKDHFTTLPEPDITKPKQEDAQGGAAGFRWKF